MLAAGSSLAVAAASALVLGTQVTGTGECPSPAEVEQRLPALSSALRVDVQPARGGVRVRILDPADHVLEDAAVSGETCAALADLAAEHVRQWAADRGAIRDEGELAPPPVVEVPGLPPSSPDVVPGPPPAPFSLPIRLGLGAGAGVVLDGAGSAPAFELWGLIGPAGAPFWGEIAFATTPDRALLAGQFPFSWARGSILSAGGAYRFARAPIEAVAGLQVSTLQVVPLGPVNAPGFVSLDPGGYAGLRALVLLGGVVSGWVGARISAWFLDHRIEVGDPLAGNVASVPFLGVWFGLGVEAGDQL